MRTLVERGLVGLGVVGLVASLSGCGSDSKSAASGAKSSGGSKVTDCSKAPKDLVNQKLGLSVGDPEVTNNDPVVVCTYHSTTGSGTAIVRFENGTNSLSTSKQGFTSAGQPVADHSGVGDEGFTSSIGAGQFVTNTLVARKGSVALLVSSSASITRISDLENAIFAKF